MVLSAEDSASPIRIPDEDLFDASHERYWPLSSGFWAPSGLGSALRAADQPAITINTDQLTGAHPAPCSSRSTDCPRWLRTHWRVGHLPPGLGRMPEAYAKAGYEVITINALRKWDIVGPDGQSLSTRRR